MLLIVAALFWVMVGLRFQVGTDWDNYLRQFYLYRHATLAEVLFNREPGFAVLNWLAWETGGGYIFLNVIVALIFCWGFFHLAKGCREPFLAVAVATPLLVITCSMNLSRQTVALGLICYLYATWDKGTVVRRFAWVLAAASFHFSAVFVLTFVALSAKTAGPLKVVAAVLIGGLIFGIVAVAPTAMEAYSTLYVSGRVQAPGATAHVLVLSTAGVAYLVFRRKWDAVYGPNPLCFNMAVTSVLAVPAIYLSSVGAYRLGLYAWPMAMYVWSGMPAIIDSALGRAFYRFLIVTAFAIVLGVWLNYANNSPDWDPYRNWLTRPANASMWINRR